MAVAPYLLKSRAETQHAGQLAKRALSESSRKFRINWNEEDTFGRKLDAAA